MPSPKTIQIPISAAKEIAKRFGYDQVIIYARVVGEPRDGIAEHMTTYGKDKANCDAAAKIGNFLKYKIMGWVKENEVKAPEPLDLYQQTPLTTELQAPGGYFPDDFRFEKSK